MNDMTGGSPGAVHLVALDAVGSTNDEAFRLGREGAPDLSLITARSQNAGRGRRGRNWSSPVGNLYASFLLRPECPVGRLAELGFVASVAAAEACNELLPAPRRVALKWPNDLLLGGAKLAGILLETIDEPPSGRMVAVGIGINVASAAPGAAYPTTCLADHGAADLAQLRDALAARFADRYRQWRHHGFAPARDAWTAMAMARGRPLTVRIEAETVQGTFGGIDETGALLLDLPSGLRRRVLAGDVMFQAA